MGKRLVAVHALDPVTAAGVVSQLRGCDELELVVESKLSRHDVHVVAAWRTSPEVVELVRRTAGTSGAAVVLIADEVREDDVTELAHSGVITVLPRTALPVDRLISSVCTGRRRSRLPGAASERLLAQLHRVDRNMLRPRGIDEPYLNERERELLRLLADGASTSEAAARLAYSERTVKNVLQVLMARFALRDRAHAVAFAVRLGVI